jgi:peptidoglycan/xylan/chitin deacetylase (PgdA/CDA1 family)
MKQRQLLTLVCVVVVCLVLAGYAFLSRPTPTTTAAPTAQTTTAIPMPSQQPEQTPTTGITPTLAAQMTATPTPQATQVLMPSATVGPQPMTGTPGYCGSPQNGFVLIEFADGKEGVYTVAFPVMRARGLHGLLYVPIEPTIQEANGHLTPAQLDELNAAGWDVASHGWTHDDPTLLTEAQLVQHLLASQQWLLSRGYTKGARSYGAPSGNCTAHVGEEAARYYDTVWCGDYSKFPPGYRFAVVSCGGGVDWATRIQPALANLIGQPDRVARCSFHDLVSQNANGSQADLNRLTTILDYLQANKINIVTMSDLLDGTVCSRP